MIPVGHTLETVPLAENPNFKVFRCSWSVSAVAVLDSEENETGADPDSCCSWSRCCFWASALIGIKETKKEDIMGRAKLELKITTMIPFGQHRTHP